MLSRMHADSCSQPAGDGIRGGTDTCHTGCTLRGRRAQPQRCVYGAASGEAAFKAVHPDSLPQADENGDGGAALHLLSEGPRKAEFSRRVLYN